jgi:anthranilate synthase component 1
MTKEEFLRLTGQGWGTLPVSSTQVADQITPTGAALALNLHSRPFAFLLESAQTSPTDRYSFLGLTMEASYQIRGKSLIVEREGKIQTQTGDPLVLLRQEAQRRKAPPGEIPLCSGFVGYLGYDIADNRQEELPEGYLVSPKELLIFDHAQRTVRAVVNVAVADLPEEELEDAYRRAKARACALLDRIQRPQEPTLVRQLQLTFTSSTKKDKFIRGVEKIKTAIKAGSLQQVVLSQRLVAEGQADPLSTYRLLRSTNPSPYLFWLHFPKLDLVGSSPETLVKLEEGRAKVLPIAGTRPRGKDQLADQRLAQELLGDQKELAEHMMLVELGKEDLAQVAQRGSVQVDAHLELVRYSHVMHLVSELSCQLDEKYDAFDLFQACFPAGTVSGAPRGKAMKLIQALEPHSRGPYGGGVGYFSFAGNMDFCIAIRMLVFQGNQLWVQAGAGIVEHSQPEAEYQETMLKAQALLGAVAQTGGGRNA